MSNPARGQNVRGHLRRSYNRCLVCRQKIEKHCDGVTIDGQLVHVKHCARKYRREVRR